MFDINFFNAVFNVKYDQCTHTFVEFNRLAIYSVLNVIEHKLHDIRFLNLGHSVECPWLKRFHAYTSIQTVYMCVNIQ